MYNRVLVIGTEKNSGSIMEKLKSEDKFYLLKDTPTTDEKEVHNLSKHAHHIIITTNYEKEKEQQYDVYENLYNIKHNTTVFDNFYLNNIDDMFKKYENKNKLHLFINDDKTDKKDLSYHFCLYRVQINDVKLNSINFNIDDLFKNLN